MTTKNDGGPAFPNTVKITDENFSDLRGMTLRDYFAAKAIGGILAYSVQSGADMYARTAYTIADAMLLERAK